MEREEKFVGDEAEIDRVVLNLCLLFMCCFRVISGSGSRIRIHQAYIHHDFVASRMDYCAKKYPTKVEAIL